MIRRYANGNYYCDGHECGFPLAWTEADREDPSDGSFWTCLDCGSSMYAEAPKAPDPQEAA